MLLSQRLERLLPFDWQGTNSVHVRAINPCENPDQHDLHVRQHPCALLVIVGEERNARRTGALRNGWKSRLFFGLVIRLHDALLRLWRGSYVDRNGRKSHVVVNECEALVWINAHGVRLSSTS
jgi:hypothetical protein